MGDDFQILLLIEWIERQPQAESFGERDFFLGGFARMNFTILGVFGFEVFAHLFRDQMAAIAGCVDEQVVVGRGDAAIEHRLSAL